MRGKGLTVLTSILYAQESLHAHSEYSNSEDNGSAQRRINQYTIKQEIGRGSCGSVHIAVDQYGREYVRLIIFVLITGVLVLSSKFVLADHCKRLVAALISGLRSLSENSFEKKLDD